MTTSIDDIVKVTINALDGSVGRKGFGVPLFVTTTTQLEARVEYYEGSPTDILAALITDGFATSDAAYLMVQTALSQEPRINRVALGQQLAGDANVAAAMNAILAYDSEGWYQVAHETVIEADILSIAGIIEATPHIYIAQTADAAVLAGTAGNVALDLQSANYNRSAVIYHNVGSERADAAWIGRGAAFNLDTVGGHGTWANKVLTGITPDTLSGTQRSAIQNANGNTYERRLGQNVTRKGKMASGRFIDSTVAIDFIDQRLTENVFAYVAKAYPGVPFDDEEGLPGLEAVVRGTLDTFVGNKIIQRDYTLYMPTLADLLQADVSARKANKIQFNAKGRGFIQDVEIVGNILF